MCIICEWKSDNVLSKSRLTKLDCGDCKNLTSLPELPDTLISLICDGCVNLTSLPELPHSLRYLNIDDTRIVKLPKLPDNLIHLSCWDCRKLATLPELPQSLEELFCSGCTSLIKLPELPVRLELLDCSKTRLTELPDTDLVNELFSKNITWLPNGNKNYKKNIENLKILQRNLKKLCFRRRLVRQHYLKKFLYTDLVKMVLKY